MAQDARHGDLERQERQSQGVIREVAGGMKRLLDLGGRVIATIDRTPIGLTTKTASVSVRETA